MNTVIDLDVVFEPINKDTLYQIYKFKFLCIELFL